MEISIDLPENCLFIERIENNAYFVDGKAFSGNFVISPNHILSPWLSSTEVENLTINDFKPLIELKPECILFGTGKVAQFPSIEITATLSQQSIGFEVMNSVAACRTYSILCSEGRKVVAGIL